MLNYWSQKRPFKLKFVVVHRCVYKGTPMLKCSVASGSRTLAASSVLHTVPRTYLTPRGLARSQPLQSKNMLLDLHWSQSALCLCSTLQLWHETALIEECHLYIYIQYIYTLYTLTPYLVCFVCQYCVRVYNHTPLCVTLIMTLCKNG